MLWGSFFYVIFIKKIYIRAKLKECIFRQRRSVYIRANPFHLKLQNFAFCESCSSYKGGERWKSDPSVKSPKVFEGGGDWVDKYGNFKPNYFQKGCQKQNGIFQENRQTRFKICVFWFGYYRHCQVYCHPPPPRTQKKVLDRFGLSSRGSTMCNFYQ